MNDITKFRKKCLVETSKGDLIVFQDQAEKIKELWSAPKDERKDVIEIDGSLIRMSYIQRILTPEQTEEKQQKQQGFFRCPDCKGYYKRGERCECQIEKNLDRGSDTEQRNRKECQDRLKEGNHLWKKVGSTEIVNAKEMTEKEQKDFLYENARLLLAKKIISQSHFEAMNETIERSEYKIGIKE